MTYQPIHDTSLTDEEHTYKKSSRKLNLHAASGFVVGLLVGAAAVSLVGPPWSENLLNGKSTTTFTSNVTFMSLDHQFDQVWDIKREMSYANLRMSDQETADADMPVIIAM